MKTPSPSANCHLTINGLSTMTNTMLLKWYSSQTHGSPINDVLVNITMWYTESLQINRRRIYTYITVNYERYIMMLILI